jgi:ethanolamine utilization protein EutA (predicted chaperonin)
MNHIWVDEMGGTCRRMAEIINLIYYGTNRKVADSIIDQVNFPAGLRPGVYSASNRNEYQKY